MSGSNGQNQPSPVPTPAPAPTAIPQPAPLHKVTDVAALRRAADHYRDAARTLTQVALDAAATVSAHTGQDYWNVTGDDGVNARDDFLEHWAAVDFDPGWYASRSHGLGGNALQTIADSSHFGQSVHACFDFANQLDDYADKVEQARAAVQKALQQAADDDAHLYIEIGVFAVSLVITLVSVGTLAPEAFAIDASTATALGLTEAGAATLSTVTWVGTMVAFNALTIGGTTALGDWAGQAADNYYLKNMGWGAAIANVDFGQVYQSFKQGAAIGAISSLFLFALPAWVGATFPKLGVAIASTPQLAAVVGNPLTRLLFSGAAWTAGTVAGEYVADPAKFSWKQAGADALGTFLTVGLFEVLGMPFHAGQGRPTFAILPSDGGGKPVFGYVKDGNFFVPVPGSPVPVRGEFVSDPSLFAMPGRDVKLPGAIVAFDNLAAADRPVLREQLRAEGLDSPVLGTDFSSAVFLIGPNGEPMLVRGNFTIDGSMTGMTLPLSARSAPVPETLPVTVTPDGQQLGFLDGTDVKLANGTLRMRLPGQDVTHVFGQVEEGLGKDGQPKVALLYGGTVREQGGKLIWETPDGQIWRVTGLDERPDTAINTTLSTYVGDWNGKDGPIAVFMGEDGIVNADGQQLHFHPEGGYWSTDEPVPQPSTSPEPPPETLPDSPLRTAPMPAVEVPDPPEVILLPPRPTIPPALASWQADLGHAWDVPIQRNLLPAAPPPSWLPDWWRQPQQALQWPAPPGPAIDGVRPPAPLLPLPVNMMGGGWQDPGKLQPKPPEPATENDWNRLLSTVQHLEQSLQNVESQLRHAFGAGRHKPEGLAILPWLSHTYQTGELQEFLEGRDWTIPRPEASASPLVRLADRARDWMTGDSRERQERQDLLDRARRVEVRTHVREQQLREIDAASEVERMAENMLRGLTGLQGAAATLRSTAEALDVEMVRAPRLPQINDAQAYVDYLEGAIDEVRKAVEQRQEIVGELLDGLRELEELGDTVDCDTTLSVISERVGRLITQMELAERWRSRVLQLLEEAGWPGPLIDTDPLKKLPLVGVDPP